jgi:CRP/FNR family transcriptional regulator, anaerobic regulatory protein
MLQVRLKPHACPSRPLAADCGACGARAFSVCATLEGEDLARLSALAEPVRFAAGQALTRQGERADYLFNITSGSARVQTLMADGRRQITGFLFAGDFVGLEATARHAGSVEAIEPLTACRFAVADYRTLVRQTPALEAVLLERAGHELTEARAQILLLGRKTAEEKLASFLLSLADRDPMRPHAEGQLRLPMSRTEIADYLGLTIETVSRVLGRFKTAGIVQLVSVSELRILRPERLTQLADSEG